MRKIVCTIVGHRWVHSGVVLGDRKTHHFWKCDVCGKKKSHEKKIHPEEKVAQ